MATLKFMNHTIFDHGASNQLDQVLAVHGIRRPLLCTDDAIADLSIHAAKDVCTLTNARPCSAEEYGGFFEIAIG